MVSRIPLEMVSRIQQEMLSRIHKEMVSYHDKFVYKPIRLGSIIVTNGLVEKQKNSFKI